MFHRSLPVGLLHEIPVPFIEWRDQQRLQVLQDLLRAARGLKRRVRGRVLPNLHEAEEIGALDLRIDREVDRAVRALPQFGQIAQQWLRLTQGARARSKFTIDNDILGLNRLSVRRLQRLTAGKSAPEGKQRNGVPASP